MGVIRLLFKFGDNMEWIKDLYSEEMIPLEEFEEKYLKEE